MKGNEVAQKLIDNIGKVIIGKEEKVRLLLTALVADGHVLIEDVPGTGKTKLAKALARSVAADYARIQFTPDLLPSDVTGLNVYDRQQNAFVLRKGPVFTNVLLADEINRATPRTQAGLLECMEERQVTIDGESYPTGDPFFVIATQNPVETTGTFPLPEAQLDRFMMKLSMGLPTREEEMAIIGCYLQEDPLDSLTAVITAEDLKNARQEAAKVFVHESIRSYMVQIAEETRAGEEVLMGVSPRGTLALLRAVKAYAYLQGRTYCVPDDVRILAPAVLEHRIILGYGRKQEARDFLKNILLKVPAPTEDFKE